MSLRAALRLPPRSERVPRAGDERLSRRAPVAPRDDLHRQCSNVGIASSFAVDQKLFNHAHEQLNPRLSLTSTDQRRAADLVQNGRRTLRGRWVDRILLERIYGKLVWEALLRNPRITAPEVARIARMGALPKPLLEIIVGNSAWLQVPEVRRALLGNPRLAPEMIGRVLRLLPKHELKLVPAQLAYPAPVRDVARRMLKDA